MMLIRSIFALLAFTSVVLSKPNMKELEGTWTSKSNTVFTGPGFYDPVEELLIEPDLPGISYSFTADGYFEQALYRVTSNPQNHSCATATLTFQHGKYELKSNGSLFLHPFEVDGRQLLSEPCGQEDNSATQSQYSRWSQMIWFQTYQVFVSSYNGRYTLQLFQFDGSKMQPLYLAYRPPLMLPTYALNPTDDSSKTKLSMRKRIKRSFENQYRTNARKEFSNERFDFYWWIGVTTLAVASGAMFLR